MPRLLHISILLAFVAPFVAAQSCSAGSPCPQSAPCCSQYGQCGIGAYCLGGCDPVSSFSLKSCVPAPVCESGSWDWSNIDSITPITQYLGDASKADWVSSGEPVAYDGTMLLTMAQGTVGTLVASTHYVWYGKVSGRFKTSAGAGVVTAFILLSDVKDEIDFEFVGTDLLTAQTNFYSQGVTNYENGENNTIPSNSLSNYHDYVIDWQPDQLTWSIDGSVVRTLKKADTWNATANRFTYPQTPARVQLSLWPAGLPTNPQGTINWAGGVINWNSPYMSNGYYYSQFDKIDIQCYNPPSGANVQGSTSYVYSDKAATNNTVQVTNNPTVLKCFTATGLDLNGDCPATSDTSSVSNTTVPGIDGNSGTGTGSNGQRGSDSSSSASTGTATASTTGSASTGFIQGGTSNSGPANMQPETVIQGSLFAAIIAIAGLCFI